MNLFNDFISKTKSNNKKLICAQVRIGGKTRHGAHDHQFMLSEHLDHWWQFINQTFVSKFKDQSEYSVFITSDFSDTHSKAAKFFGENITFNYGDSSVHVDRDGGGCNEVTEKVFLDFYTLGYCDMTLTSRSGYGMLGTFNRPDPFKDYYIYSHKPLYEKLVTVPGTEYSIIRFDKCYLDFYSYCGNEYQ